MRGEDRQRLVPGLTGTQSQEVPFAGSTKRCGPHRVRGQLEVYLARGLVGVGQKPGEHPDPQLWGVWNFLCPKHVSALAFSPVSEGPF